MDRIHPSWKELFDQYDFNMDQHYSTAKDAENIVFPQKSEVFRVFQMDVADIRICLLGQDCYHGYKQAHGLSFSVPVGIDIPPSLRNIYKELKLEFPERSYEFKHGCLENWFQREKIFLLNSALTVQMGEPGSHMHIWQGFTDDVIKYIVEKNKKCIFLLLGNFAKAKGAFIPDKTRIVVEAHPSPLARGFVGSGVFKRVEVALGESVDWSI